MLAIWPSFGIWNRMAAVFLKIRKKSSAKFGKSEIRGPRDSFRACRTESPCRRVGLLLRRPAARRLGRLARPRQRLVAQAFDLASRQRDADLADPFALSPPDRLAT